MMERPEVDIGADRTLRRVVFELETARARVEDAIEVALSRIKDATVVPGVCPHCHRRDVMEDDPRAIISELSPLLARVVEALAGRGIVPLPELIAAAYRNVPPAKRPGPNGLKSTIRRGRSSLVGLGWDIQLGPTGRGYRLVRLTKNETGQDQEGRNG